MADERDDRLKKRLPQLGTFAGDLTALPGDRFNYVERLSLGNDMSKSKSEETVTVAEEVLTRAKAPKEVKNTIKDNIRRGEMEKGLTQGSLTSKFTEGLAAWLPSIAAAAFGGTKALAQVAGTQAQLLKSQEAPDQMELERLRISQENLEQRKEQLKLEKRRAESLDEERDERRFERSQDRVLRQKEAFGKREDIKKEKEALRQIESLKDLADVEVLPGTIGFKIAKGIAGEVGNLTEEERAAAQISPSIYRKAQRYMTAAFKGKIPAEDIKELREVSAILKGRIHDRLRDQANKFAESRKRNLHEAHQKTFRDDILLGIGISPEVEKKVKSRADRIKELEEKARK